MRTAMLAAPLLGVVVLLATASCASVWGFDPLTLAPQDGGASDASLSDASTPDTGTTNGDDASVVNLDAATPGCTGACDAGADALAPAPGLTCEPAGGTCDCSTGGTGNSAGCSPSTLGVAAANVICCADPDYPANGTCLCEWIGCTTSNGNCICGPQNGTPGGSCAKESWTCCLQTGAPECVCSNSACLSGFTPFGSSCSVPDVKCPGVQRKVDACR